MKIACLAWGSLVWEPKDLPISSEWFKDGPNIHVEYLRKSANKRLTLVLDPTALAVQSLWATMKSETVAEAIAALGQRESIPDKNWHKYVGHWTAGMPSPSCIDSLPTWVQSKGIDHLIWTSLPPKFDEQVLPATPDEVVAYLSALTGDERERAEEYVRKTPKQIRTFYRQTIEELLHWTYIAE